MEHTGYAHTDKLFLDRKEAGKELANRLAKYKSRQNVQVLALPRGGVPVAFEVAKLLELPLDIFITRKLRFPDQPELALGALAETGEVFLNEELRAYYSNKYLEEEISYQKEEISRRQDLYRDGDKLPRLEDKEVILVDDGIATGATAIAAVRALRASGVKKIIVAIPVAPQDSVDRFSSLADELVVLFTPSPFYAVGLHYSDFSQVSDDEVKSYLTQSVRKKSDNTR